MSKSQTFSNTLKTSISRRNCQIRKSSTSMHSNNNGGRNGGGRSRTNCGTTSEQQQRIATVNSTESVYALGHKKSHQSTITRNTATVDDKLIEYDPSDDESTLNARLAVADHHHCNHRSGGVHDSDTIVEAFVNDLKRMDTEHSKKQQSMATTSSPTFVPPSPPPPPQSGQPTRMANRSTSSEIIGKIDLHRRLQRLLRRSAHMTSDPDDGLAGDKTQKYCLKYSHCL